MHKKGWIYLVLALGVISTACSPRSTTAPKENEGAVQKGETAQDETVQEEAVQEEAVQEKVMPEGEDASAYRFPEQYEKVSDSGKISFQCRLELPENLTEPFCSVVSVHGLFCCDHEKAKALFLEGREIEQEWTDPASEGRVIPQFYSFVDGGLLALSEGINYTSENAKYYSYINVFNPALTAAFQETPVSFKSAEECIGELKRIMEELGYSIENFAFASFPVNAEVMEDLEEQYIAEELLSSGNRKESWGPEDDAYAIYAYQTCNMIPVFHEFMSVAKELSYDTPDNAMVSAIYSARGIESVHIWDHIYNLQEEEGRIALKPFEDIAAVVEEKYENLLKDASYQVVRAKLFERVYRNTEQEYTVEPVWYFEVIENNENMLITVVDAETGKEIYI